MKASLLITALIFGINLSAQTSKKVFEVNPQIIINPQPSNGCTVIGPYWGSDGCVSFFISCSGMSGMFSATNCGNGTTLSWFHGQRAVSSAPYTIDDPFSISIDESSSIYDLETLRDLQEYCEITISTDVTYEDADKIITYKAGTYPIAGSQMKISMIRSN